MPTRAVETLPRLLRGDPGGAMEALVAGAQAGRGWEVPFAVVDPLLEPLGSDPRWAEVIQALVLPDWTS